MALSKTSRVQSLRELGGLDLLPPEVVKMAGQMDVPKQKGGAARMGPPKGVSFKPFVSKDDSPGKSAHRTSTKDIPPPGKR